MTLGFGNINHFVDIRRRFLSERRQTGVGHWSRRICSFPVAIPSQVAEILSALIAHYDDAPFWISAGTNKDDLEWPWMPDSI